MTATVVVFSPLDSPVSLAFVLIPFLGWAALRAPMRETLVQLMVVAVIAHSMTTQGFGPTAVDETTTHLEAELFAAVLALFICACALSCIPFAIAVGAQRRQSWQVGREKARVEQLVQGASSIAIIGTNRNGHLDLFNPGCVRAAGLRPRRGARPLAADVPHRRRGPAPGDAAGDRGRLRRGHARARRPGRGAMDVEFLHKDGSVRTLQLSMSRLVDESGAPIGYVSTGEDVTHRVQQQRVLEEALEVERRALEHQREVDAVKDSFVSGVSHELRTPITSILGYLEMLEEGGFGPLHQGQVQALGRVKGNSRRLLSLIDDLLMLSRIQDGSLAVATCQLDLRDVVAGGPRGDERRRCSRPRSTAPCRCPRSRSW